MLSVRLAQLAGVETCECVLVPMELVEHEGQLPIAGGAHFLAVSRFERGAHSRVHVEDFAQVFSVDLADKHRHISCIDTMHLMLSRALTPRVLRTLCKELGLLEAPLRAVLRRCMAAALTLGARNCGQSTA